MGAKEQEQRRGCLSLLLPTDETSTTPPTNPTANSDSAAKRLLLEKPSSTSTRSLPRPLSHGPGRKSTQSRAIGGIGGLRAEKKKIPEIFRPESLRKSHHQQLQRIAASRQMSWVQADSLSIPMASAIQWRIDSKRGTALRNDSRGGDAGGGNGPVTIKKQRSDVSDDATTVTNSSAVTMKTSHTSKKPDKKSGHGSSACLSPPAAVTRVVSMMSGPSSGNEVESGTGSIPLATATVAEIAHSRQDVSRTGGAHTMTHPSTRFDNCAELLSDDDEGISPMAHDANGPPGRRQKRHSSYESRNKGCSSEKGGKSGTGLGKVSSVPGAMHMTDVPYSPKKGKAGQFYGAHFDPESDPRVGASHVSHFYDYPKKEDSDRLFVADNSKRSLSVGGLQCTAATACAVVIVAVGIAAIAVGVSFSSPGKSGDGGGGDWSVNSESLQAPPETLALMCSQESINTPWGYDACRNVCERAKCCEVPGGQPGSCVSGHGDECAIYKTQCSSMSDITVPPPPGELVRTCSARGVTIDEDYKKCKDMCDRASCCFREPGELGTCHGQHKDDCAVYQTACSFLSEVLVPQPPADLASLCSSMATDEGRKVCEQVCSVAACCNLPSDEPASCKEGNDNTCALYEVACSFSSAKVPDPPQDIIEKCAPDRLDTFDGYKNCHDICETASCCTLPKGDTSRCFDNDDNIDKCVIFQTACSFMRDVKVPPPPKDLVNSCTPESVATMRGYNKCEDVCSLAPCCLLPRTDIGSCLHTNGDTCAVYQTACDVLDDADSFDKYLLSICTDGKVATRKGYEECKQGCDSADCCFLPSWHMDSCSYNKEKCEKYALACYVLDDAPFAEENKPSNTYGDSSGAVIDIDVPQAPFNLFEVCSVESLGTEDGYGHCQALCDPAECCEATGDSSCLEDNRYTCAQYTPCFGLEHFGVSDPAVTAQSGDDMPQLTAGPAEQQLHSRGRDDDDQYEEVAALVAEACEDDYATESEFCKKFCKPYMCCFDEPRKNCQREMGKVCDAHAPCAALVGLWDESSEEGRDV